MGEPRAGSRALFLRAAEAALIAARAAIQIIDNLRVRIDPFRIL